MSDWGRERERERETVCIFSIEGDGVCVCIRPHPISELRNSTILLQSTFVLVRSESVAEQTPC